MLSAALQQALGLALLHSLWQAAAVALVLALLLRFIRNASIRYLLACTGLALALALPISTFLSNYQPDRSVQNVSQPTTTTTVETLPVTTQPVPASPSPETPSAGPVRETPATSPAPRRFDPARLLPALSLLWLLGVGFMSLRLATQLWQVRRFAKRSVVASQALQRQVQALSARLGVARSVRVLETRLLDSPAVTGVLRPTLFVPFSAVTGLDSAQLELILLHELAHIKRHDYLVNLLQSLAETLLFYHPAIWWLSHTIRQERENACDDLVVNVTGDRLGYGRALLNLEQSRQTGLTLAAGDGDLQSRVKRVVGVPVKREGSSWLIGLFVLSLLTLLGVSGATQGADEEALDIPDYEVWITKSPDVYINIKNDPTRMVGLDEGEFIIIEEREGGSTTHWLLLHNEDGSSRYFYAKDVVDTGATDLSGASLVISELNASESIESGSFAELPGHIEAWLERTFAKSLRQLAEVNDEAFPSYTSSIPIYSGNFWRDEPVGSFSFYNDLGALWEDEEDYNPLFTMTEEDWEELLSEVPEWSEEKHRYILLEVAITAINQADHLRTYNLVDDSNVLTSFGSLLTFFPELKPDLTEAATIIRDEGLRANFLALLAAAPDVPKPPAPSLEERNRLMDELEGLGESARTVVIDAGHGGKDPGATVGNTFEKNLNLRVAELLKDRLEAQGVRVILTREQDEFLSLAERVERIPAGANAVISLHTQIAQRNEAQGFSVVAANDTGLELGTKLGLSLEAGLEAENRGVSERAFHLLIESPVPAAMVELGFMSNAAELAKLQTNNYQASLADALANGITDYLDSLR